MLNGNSYTNLAKLSCIYFLIHDLGYPVLSDPQSSWEFPVDKKKKVTHSAEYNGNGQHHYISTFI